MKSLTRTIAIALFAAAMGCGEDVTAPDPLDGVDIPLEGAWEVTRFVYHNPPGGRAPHDRAVLGFEYTVGSGRNFVTIEEGALRVAKEYGAGFRRKYETTYADSAGVLTIDGRAYPYTLSVTTLALVHPDVEIELTRRASAPDVDEWVVDYVSTESHVSAFQADGDITWFNDDLWVSGGPSNRDIIRYPRDTFTAFSLDVEPIAPTAIDFLGGLLRGNHGTNASLYVISPGTGSAGSPVLALGGSIRAITNDGANLWVVSAAARQVHVYDMDDGALVDAIDLGVSAELAGGVIVDGSLYLSTGDVVTGFRMVEESDDTLGLEAQFAFRLPGHEIRGVAHDGANFWVNALDPNTGPLPGTMMLHEVGPPEKTR